MDWTNELPCLLGLWLSLANRKLTQEIRKKLGKRIRYSPEEFLGLWLSNKSQFPWDAGSKQLYLFTLFSGPFRPEAGKASPLILAQGTALNSTHVFH